MTTQSMRRSGSAAASRRASSASSPAMISESGVLVEVQLPVERHP